MKKFNKIIAVILTVVITISAFPLAGFATDEDTVLEMADEYLGVTLSGKNGGFLISTREGDKLNKADNDKNLLYPSEDYDTSFTSFRITRDNGDVEEYIFGGDYGFLGLNSTDVDISILLSITEIPYALSIYSPLLLFQIEEILLIYLQVY